MSNNIIIYHCGNTGLSNLNLNENRFIRYTMDLSTHTFVDREVLVFSTLIVTILSKLQYGAIG